MFFCRMTGLNRRNTTYFVYLAFFIEKNTMLSYIGAGEKFLGNHRCLENSNSNKVTVFMTKRLVIAR